MEDLTANFDVTKKMAFAVASGGLFEEIRREIIATCLFGTIGQLQAALKLKKLFLSYLILVIEKHHNCSRGDVVVYDRLQEKCLTSVALASELRPGFLEDIKAKLTEL